MCTINNASNSTRQDWLVCPYRALDPDLIETVVRRLFGATPDQPLLVVPAPALANQAMRARIAGQADDGSFRVLELQTMDFHGSYRRAVQNLKDALRLHGSDFADVLQNNQRWLADRIEGPNIANVFKRTFYQMMLKFQLGVHPRSVGTALAIPQAVWDSWQPHLGRPHLVAQGDGTHALQRPEASGSDIRAWIYVFDIDEKPDTHASPIVVREEIATNAASIAYYALEEVPNRAFAEAGSAATVVAAIQRRLSAWWPDLEGQAETS